MSTSAKKTTPLGSYRSLRGWDQDDVAGRVKLPNGENPSRQYVGEIERDTKGERLRWEEQRRPWAAAYDLPLDVFDKLRAGKRGARWALSKALGVHGATEGGVSRHVPQ